MRPATEAVLTTHTLIFGQLQTKRTHDHYNISTYTIPHHRQQNDTHSSSFLSAEYSLGTKSSPIVEDAAYRDMTPTTSFIVRRGSVPTASTDRAIMIMPAKLTKARKSNQGWPREEGTNLKRIATEHERS